MTTRGAPATLFLITVSAALAALLSACKDEPKPVPPPQPQPVAQAQTTEPAVTREQAMATLLALPEVKAWSAEIEQRSRGKAHGAIIEDDPAPRLINGRQYWQLSFVENRKVSAKRRESFLVAQAGEQILVEDLATNTVLSLDEWRRQVRRVELTSAD